LTARFLSTYRAADYRDSLLSFTDLYGTCAEGVGKEPPVPSPDILRAIRSLAPFVARMGPAFEALALQKNSAHPDFRFLYGGEGREYYRWQVRWPAGHRLGFGAPQKEEEARFLAC